MEKWKKAAYYASGALGGLLLAGAMGAAAIGLLPYLAGGAFLWEWAAALHTVGAAAAVWCAAAGAVGMFLVRGRLRTEEEDEVDEAMVAMGVPAAEVRKRPAHERMAKHEKAKVGR